MNDVDSFIDQLMDKVDKIDKMDKNAKHVCFLHKIC